MDKFPLVLLDFELLIRKTAYPIRDVPRRWSQHIHLEPDNNALGDKRWKGRFARDIGGGLGASLHTDHRPKNRLDINSQLCRIQPLPDPKYALDLILVRIERVVQILHNPTRFSRLS